MDATAIDKRIWDTIEHLEPSDNINLSLGRLLKHRIEHDLAIYEQMDLNLSSHYSMSFDEFTSSELMVEPSFSVEQDYFDWELAVTMIKELRKDLANIYPIVNK